MADRPLHFGDRVRVEAPDLGYHGWEGIVARQWNRHNAGFIAVRFQRPDRGPNGADVGYFRIDDLHLDAITALGRLLDD